MSWNYKYPSPGHYDSEEEYEEACEAYEYAEDNYIEDYLERVREKRYAGD